MKYEMYNWFYGATIGAQQAEDLLLEIDRDGCFLVRISATKKYYVLNLHERTTFSSKIYDYRIYQTPGGRFHFEGTKDCYPTLPALIEHHTKCKEVLPILLKCTPKGSYTAGFSAETPARVFTPVVSKNVQAAAPPPRRAEPQKAKCVCKWQIDLSELEMISKIGQGSFGVVHQAKLRGTAMVAVKMMIAGSMSEDEFIKEAHTMTELKHPHIVRLCGICTKQKPIFIVTEYMKYGSLLSYLVRNKRGLLKRHTSLQNICAQVVRGMAYLESMRFVHRDLASRNCLVGSDGVVKVSDFGMSKFMSSNHYQGNEASAMCAYTVPPEVISHRLYSTKSDVWAFGLLMWEVFTCGNIPYGQLNAKEVLRYVEKGYIMDKPPAANDDDYDLMTHCWAYKPHNRPSFAELEASLKAIGGH